MNIKFAFLSFFLFFNFWQAKGQDRITVNIPTAASETEYIWWTLQETTFFEEHGYTVSLPHGTLIDQLKEKSKNSTLTDGDYE